MSSTTRFLQLTAWVVSLVAGFAWLASYETTAGAAASPPANWPTASRIARVPGQPTLLLFAHARCPCTRASLGELERLMIHAKDRAAVHVVLFDPDVAPGPLDTDLAPTANAIPEVRTARDPDRREARLFHAATSGQVVFYDAVGRLRFAGGITGSRGHAGDNAGNLALIELLHGRNPKTAASPVFGCPLNATCCATATITPRLP